MTDQGLAEAVENHHQRDEMDQQFQDALHQLAQRCGACGQPIPEEQ